MNASKATQTIGELIEKDCVIEQNKEYSKKIHDLRKANMDLRHQQSKLQSKVKSLEEENRDLKNKVQLLDKKIEADCRTILDQLKTLSGVEQAFKHV